MKIIAANMEQFPSLFPPGSETGDTKASAKIWEDMAGFEAAAAKLVTDAKAAEAVAADGLDAFKTAFGAVGANCGGCHEAYRN
jgi:cytochrome c556